MSFKPFIFIRKFLHLSYLILLILAILTLYFSVVMEKSIRSASKNDLHKAGQQAVSQAENALSRSDSIVRSLASSQLLLEFLEKTYTPGDDFAYYHTDIRSFIAACAGIDFHSYVKIYMTNTSIPEGYGYFYQLKDVASDSAVKQFADSSSDTDIIYLEDTLMEMKKLYSISGSFLGIASVRIPKELLWGSFPLRQILSYDRTLLINLSSKTSLDNSSETLNTPGLLYECWQPDDIPLTFYFIDEVPPVYTLFRFFLLAAIGLIAACMTAFYRQQQAGFRKTSYYLSQMEISLEQNMEFRFDEASNDEFSFISRYINRLLDKISALISRIIEQETAQKQTQIQILQNQINPHFIYNTMEIFSSQMELYGHYEESDAMSSFAGMLRYNIRTNSPYAALQEELSQVTGYITLQKLRYPNISAEFAVPPMLLSIEIVRFLLQPLAENSIVHGMPNAGYPLRISVSAAPSDLGILFSVYDNGTGIPEEKAAELNAYFNDQTNYDDSSSSIGLNNINHRLRLFYGSASCLHIKQNSPIGCCVSFWIPLSQEHKAESHLSRPKVLL